MVSSKGSSNGRDADKQPADEVRTLWTWQTRWDEADGENSWRRKPEEEQEEVEEVKDQEEEQEEPTVTPQARRQGRSS